MSLTEAAPREGKDGTSSLRSDDRDRPVLRCLKLSSL